MSWVTRERVLAGAPWPLGQDISRIPQSRGVEGTGTRVTALAEGTAEGQGGGPTAFMECHDTPGGRGGRASR